jgi:lysophospholipase L1-like esterase
VSGPDPDLLAGANGPGFAALVEAALRPHAQVANLGVGGSTTGDWVANLREHGAPQAPGEVVVVLLGTNDALVLPKRAPTTRAAFRENLRALAAGYAKGFRTVMLMTPPPAPAENPFASPEWTARLAGYRDEVRAACAELERVVCGPDLFALLDAKADFHAGNLHPNARGHRRIADALAAALRALLESGRE